MIDWIFGGFAVVLLFLTSNGFQPSHIIAGFIGAIARALVAKTGSLLENLTGGFSGAIFAAYFTPAVCAYLGIIDPQTANVVAFSVGLFGIYIAQAVIKIGKNYAANPGKLKRDFGEFIARLLK